MTHAELDQIAARTIFTTDLLGKGGLQNYVALTEPERDALLALAREGLAAREAQSVERVVWVAEQGAYSSRGIIGVYATAEDGMAAHPIPPNYKYPDTRTAGNMSRRGGWQQDADGNWHNGLDWDDGISLERWVINGRLVPATPPTSGPDGTP